MRNDENRMTEGSGVFLGRLQDMIQSVTDPVVNLSRKWSLWPLTSGIMCCALEMMAAGCSRFDTERFGMYFRPSPRHSDVMIINGPITHMYAARMKQLYDQMPHPKWVIATGECAISGGPFWDSYSIVGGGDEIVPVDVYVPGCPVRPEAIIAGICALQKQVTAAKKWKPPEIPEAPQKLVKPPVSQYKRKNENDDGEQQEKQTKVEIKTIQPSSDDTS